jgi:hypothetical protein
MRQGATLKQGHKRGGKGHEPLAVNLERAFATDGVAQQERKKVADLIAAKPATDQAHLPRDGFEHSVRAQVLSNEDRFGKPGGHRRLWRFGGLYLQTGMGYGGHGSLQRDSLMTVPSYKRLLPSFHR